MKISLKELRETMVWLEIIARKRLGACSEIPAAGVAGSLPHRGLR
jgi:hypothetical protein